MLLEIEGSLPCFSDTLRVQSENWQSTLILLSMFGPRNAVRAAWATLSKTSGRRGYRESIVIGNMRVAMGKDITYSSVNAPLERGLLHCVIFHPMLSHNAPDAGFIYQVGPDAPTQYFDRLSRWCPVPLRTSWREPLWGIGRKQGAIVEVPGHGRDLWNISTKRDVWEPIVRDALISGELT